MKRMRATLLLASSPRDAWETTIAPWLERVLPETWKRDLPSLVVVPTRGHANALKARLLERGSSQLGVDFVTPTTLRELLTADDLAPRAEPEHLRLLLAVAAAEIEKQSDETVTLSAKAVTRSPALLLRALDRLHTAGWKSEQLQLTSFEPIIRQFNELLKQCHFLLPGEIDRLRFQEAVGDGRKFSEVLIAGFDGSHWPNWFLLRTVVAAAENATVVLEEPHQDFSDIDLCWIGSWEEALGEARPSAKPVRSKGDSLFSEEEMRGAAQSPTRFDFLIGTNAAEQAEAITRQCIRYLSDAKCTRLGMIFPGVGALPRLVANRLAQLEIPHNDGLAHIVPGIFETAEWQAWLELQRAPRLNSFLRFLNALPDPAVLSPNLSRSAFEKILRESYSEVLLDDLDVLCEFCACQIGEKFQSVVEALRSLPFLPPRASLAQFLEQTQAALAHLDWKQPAIEIANVSRDWPQRFDAKFSRALFLRWLEETAATFG
ncbi:MAG: hypothetical protein M3R10_00165, partial [Verrucomicrobiota bacterium]|nr:hypothetical protein [Verrucomicrobiota bacterium]